MSSWPSASRSNVTGHVYNTGKPYCMELVSNEESKKRERPPDNPEETECDLLEWKP